MQPVATSHQSSDGANVAGHTDRKRVFFIVNNRAGNADERKLRDAAEDLLPADRYDCYFFVRERKGQSRRKAARQAVDEGYDVVVAVGGDGTVSRVADEVMGSPAVLGIVPSGSANLIARGLGLPLDIEPSVEILSSSSNLTRIDGMKVGEKTYFSHISMGIYSRIANQETATQKKWLGKTAYVWNLIKEMRHRRAWRFDVEVDGRQLRRRASLVMAANVGDSGIGSMQWGENISITDGRLDLCIFRGRSLRQYASYAWNSLRGTPDAAEAVEHRTADRTIHISADSNVPVRADGKLIGEGSVEIELIDSAVPVIVSD